MFKICWREVVGVLLVGLHKINAMANIVQLFVVAFFCGIKKFVCSRKHREKVVERLVTNEIGCSWFVQFSQGACAVMTNIIIEVCVGIVIPVFAENGDTRVGFGKMNDVSVFTPAHIVFRG